MQEVNKVKGYRNMVGITQAEMAKKIGVSERSYVAKENDISKFTVNELSAVIQVLNEHNLNVKMADLF